jgi:hypothetical protein
LIRWLARLAAGLPIRAINGPDGEPYLERYYLATLFGVRLYLHRFVASDPDRGLHDHPWAWSGSWVLSGGYTELRERETKDGATIVVERRLGAGAINRLSAQTRHRIVLTEGGEAWTLFAHGRRVKGWGFFSKDGYQAEARDAQDHATRQWWRSAR